MPAETYRCEVGQWRSLTDQDVVLATSVEDVVYGMYGAPLRADGQFPGYGKHEATLGISNTAYDWFEGARPGVEPPYPNDTFSFTDFNEANDGNIYQYHNVWGQVIPVAGVQAERDVRLQVAVPRVWHLDAAGTVWTPAHITKAQAGKLDGGFFNGGQGYSKTLDFTEDVTWRDEDDGYSIDLSPCTNPDGSIIDAQSIVHFFFNGFYPRLLIPTGGQLAISTSFRLISDTDGVDVNAAQFVGAFCGDAFTGPDVTVDPSGVNPALAQPRHVLLSDRWRHVGHVTGTEAQIRGYPRLPYLSA